MSTPDLSNQPMIAYKGAKKPLGRPLGAFCQRRGYPCTPVRLIAQRADLGG